MVRVRAICLACVICILQWTLSILSVQAELRFAIDTLGGAQYKKQVLEAVPRSFGIGGFATTFGDFYPLAEAVAQKGHPYIRVHLLWSDSHSFGDKDIKEITRLAKKYEPLCAKYPGKIALSPFCEHNLNNPDKYLNIVQKNAPSCSVINTPWMGAFSSKYKNEIHGNHKKPQGKYNYSYDGTNAVDANVTEDKKTYADAEWFFIWSPRLNLKYSMKDPAKRPQRIAEAKDRSPSPDYLRSLVYLATDKGNTSIPKGWLVKSHSEKHDKNDLKGDKLLIISPKKADEIVLKRAGKVIDKLRYYGPFSGGGFRFYSSQFGYKAGPNLEVFLGGKKYGTINGGFRDGVYR